jgi:hypothetical protein
VRRGDGAKICGEIPIGFGDLLAAGYCHFAYQLTRFLNSQRYDIPTHRMLNPENPLYLQLQKLETKTNYQEKDHVGTTF